MTAPTIANVRLTWHENDLFAGTIWVGWISRRRNDTWSAFLSTNPRTGAPVVRASTVEARLALERAAVAALKGETDAQS